MYISTRNCFAPKACSVRPNRGCPQAKVSSLTLRTTTRLQSTRSKRRAGRRNRPAGQQLRGDRASGPQSISLGERGAPLLFERLWDEIDRAVIKGSRLHVATAPHLVEPRKTEIVAGVAHGGRRGAACLAEGPGSRRPRGGRRGHRAVCRTRSGFPLRRTVPGVESYGQKSHSFQPVFSRELILSGKLL